MTSSLSRLKIGTRGSPLALAQATETRRRLIAQHPDLAEPGSVEIVVIRTTGDRITDRTLAAIGGKGLFTKEIEQALEDGEIDLAVHSMKDVPTILPDGLVIDCLLPREDPHDALFAPGDGGLDTLPPGAVVGTASLRRQAQLLHARPDLRVVPFRGNVETRLAKRAAGVVDATILAVAGLRRLGHAGLITHVMSRDTMLPAVAQGAVGIERRAADDRVADYLAPLNDAATATAVTAERALLAVLDGSCRTPIAALAELEAGRLRLSGLIARPDGSELHRLALDGPAADAARLGGALGQDLKGRAGPGFFEQTASEEPAR